MDEQRMEQRRWCEGWGQGAVLGAVLLATAWPRMAGLRFALAGGELVQWDGDSAYHLKRILDAMARFPALLRFDPAMSWPAGAACPWPDGFDLLAAAWGLLAGGGDPGRATMAVLLFTPIIAFVAAWAAMDLARLLIPEGPAKTAAVAAAGALTSLAPATVFQSTVGFLDHHVAELLAALLLAGWALRRLPGPATSSARSPLAWEVGGALATIFALWVFAGGVLYVALSCVIVLVALLRDERPRLAGSGAPALAVAAAVSALLALPAMRAHGRVFSYQLPSLLQPLLVAGAAGALALALLAARRSPRPAVRAALVAGMGAGLALVAALAIPGAAREVRDGLAGWLLRKDPWIAAIDEFQPLGGGSGGLLHALWSNFGAVGAGAPLILLAGGFTVVRAARGRGVAFLALTAAFVLFTLNQIRFGRIGVPLLMIHTAAALAAIAQRPRPREHLWAVRLFPAVAAAVLVVSDPILRPSLSPTYLGVPPPATAALDLRDHAGGDRREGVLTPWDLGHLVSFLSGLPTPTNGFGPYLDRETFRDAEGVYRKDPAALDAFLARRRLRYVLAGAMTGPMIAPVNGRSPFVRAQGARGAVLDLEYMRAFGLSPLVIGGSAIPGAGVRHLEHLMPIFATREQPPQLAFPLPAFWVYERVAGARLAGSAPPGARVLATLDLREQGRPHVWRAFADADADGRFELVVPLPTAYARPTLSTAGRYALRIGEGPAAEVEVPERAVRAGEVVRVGAIPAPDPGSTRRAGTQGAPRPPG